MDPTVQATIFAASLRRMSAWYARHPDPGTMSPLDAVRVALSDTAIAFEKASKGFVWVGQNEWGPFRPKPSDFETP